MKKALVASGIVAALGAAGAGVWLLRQRARVDRSVTQPYVEKDLTTDEIRAKLASGEFKDKLEAAKQIDKLDPAEKLRVLLKLADDPQAATRLLAVKKLRTLDDPRAKEKLARLAEEDPDPDVRDLAK